MATTTPQARHHGGRAPVGDTPLDLTRIPVFPVITVEILDGHREILVDGKTHAIPDGSSPTDAAVQAAATAVARRGLDYCRVAAVLDGVSYAMVVGADGSRHDATVTTRKRPGAARPTARPANQKAWVLPVAVMIFALVTAGVVVATVYQFRPRDLATTTAVVPQATPTELPVLPPDGWTTHADWSVPQPSAAHPAALPVNDVLLVITGAGDLAALDHATGVSRWQHELDAAPTAGPVRTTIDGVPAVGVVTPRALLWWALDDLTGPPQTVALSPQAKVSFAGTSPLIVSPGQHAAVVVAGKESQRLVPAGATAVRADDGTITALDGSGRLWRLTSTAPRVPNPVSVLRPPRPGLTLTVLGTVSQQLVVSWRSPTTPVTTIVVTDLAGRTLTYKTVTGVSGDPWHSDGQVATVSGQLVTSNPARLTTITDPAWRTTQIVAGTVYGTVGSSTATLQASGRARPSQNPTAVVPVAVDGQHAYVIASAENKPVLYALERG